ncbi:lysylphosphatidylglycerol synthase domain-containing protein [Candidatus Nitrosacidococcus tergens]|uniref:Uncharacterized protein n=1 Tax=Candidatus Nitrosacidococcus tergens TaxID=553981 RepID=A0A7G1QAB0_9GAMM|nr:lysylphosphatidylglycerol synthase domain-containing protein [Candidatus Nitrosacidococcus tergens]CAB1276549.1 membrane protein of unknown function [Candidatus Nitrosacidococcus tergens]
MKYKYLLLSWSKALMVPRRILLVLISLALLITVFGLSDIFRVLERWQLLQISTIFIVFLCALLYLILKGWQFGHLIAISGLKVCWRPCGFAFAIGEISLTLPLGVYSENYILQKTQGISFSDSAASTTVMLALEIVMLILLLGIIPIPNWPQVQIASLGGILLCSIVLFLTKDTNFLVNIVKKYITRDGWIGTIALEIYYFLSRLRLISQPSVLLSNLFITIVYMLVLMFAFYQIGVDMNATSFCFNQAIIIYSFGLLIAMSFGSLLSQFGILELSGATAAQAWGIDLQDGLAILLWFRLLWTISVWTVCFSVIFYLWGELGRKIMKDN